MKYFSLISLFFATILIVPSANANVQSVIINDGLDATFSIYTQVEVVADDAQFVRFSHQANMEQPTSYEPYVAGKKYNVTLHPGEGSKNVCAQTKNAQGIESNPVCDWVKLNTFGPNYPKDTSIRIEQGAQTTSERAVQLFFTAENAEFMAISNTGNFQQSQWVPYTRVKTWFLSGEAGYKEVYVIFVAPNGSISQVFSDNIQYTAGLGDPAGEIVINDGANQTDSIDVLIHTRNLTDVDLIRLSSKDDMSDATGYMPIRDAVSYTLPPKDGVKQVCAQFKNDRMQEESPLDCDSIILNRQGTEAPSTSRVTINDGKRETEVSRVKLNFNVQNADRMAISNFSDFRNTQWQSYKQELYWHLLAGGGERTIYVMFASAAGHITDVKTQEINVVGQEIIVIDEDVDEEANQSSVKKTVPQTFAQPTKRARKRPPQTVRTFPNGVAKGMLVKRFDRPDVYYIGQDGYRYVFPNQLVFLSWFTTQDLQLKNRGGKVVTLDNTTLASIPIGGNITFKPGAFLVKIPNNPKVYAIDRNGTLRWVTTAKKAEELYGTDWTKQVRDIPETLFLDYGIGDNITDKTSFSPTSIQSSSRSIDSDLQLKR